MGWFETKVEREIKTQQYDPEYIKLKALSEMRFFPDKGEEFEFRGGLGNQILKQLKNEDGVIYERDNPKDQWKQSNIKEYLNRLLTICLSK